MKSNNGNGGGRKSEEDTSPPEIQAIRRAFIDEFMRTGVFNSWMHEQLLGYAITQRPKLDGRTTEGKKKLGRSDPS